MKKLYLHIGWRKTGSSAIQEIITRNTVDQAFLGIKVPRIGSKVQELVTGGTPIAHHGLANFSKPKEWADNWEKFASEVASGGDSEYLVSSEIFSSVMGKESEFFVQLAEKLAIFDKVVVFCWLRRQDQYMNSLRVQKAKHGGVKNERKEYVKRFPADGNYFDILCHIERLIPNATIIPFAYSKSGDIAADFLKVLGREGVGLESEKSSRINVSVSADMFRLQLMVNAHFQNLDVEVKDIKDMEKLFVRAWDTVPESFKTEPAVPMTIAERKIIVKHFAESNRALCEKYGLDLDVFIPSDTSIRDKEYNIPNLPEPTLIDEMVDQLRTLETDKKKTKNAMIEFLSRLKL